MLRFGQQAKENQIRVRTLRHGDQSNGLSWNWEEMRGTRPAMGEDSEDIVEKGVRILTLSSWREFYEKVHSLTSKRGYVWRGQTKDESEGWYLQSSFDREVKVRDHRDRTEKLKCHLANFKKTMDQLRPGVLPRDDIDIWALGQHYGLKTPLLDWTTCPSIAAYFAFIEETHKEDSYRYVYGLNRSLERLLSKRKKAEQVLSSGRSVPFVDRLVCPSPRFTAQRGIFTKAFQGQDILDYVRNFSKKRPREVLIVKFRIPTKDRDQCLKELHSMNINHISLQLDLQHVVDCCNNRL